MHRQQDVIPIKSTIGLSNHVLSIDTTLSGAGFVWEGRVSMGSSLVCCGGGKVSLPIIPSPVCGEGGIGYGVDQGVDQRRNNRMSEHPSKPKTLLQAKA